jgi:hypothetical protein
MLMARERRGGRRNESISYADSEDKSFQSIIRRTRAAHRLLECVHSPMRLGRGSPPPKPSEAQPVAEIAEKQALPDVFRPSNVSK